jgi:hypothetical protein
MTQPCTPVPSQDIVDDFVGNAHGNFTRVKELLEQYPALLTMSASWGEYAIEAASQVGSEQIINYLLTAGAPTSICTEAVLGHTEKVKAYLEADSGLAKAAGAHGISVLYHAVIRGQSDIADMLLANGADINAGEGGNPAIHGAVMFNRPDMVDWLLAHGADVELRNYENKTPLKMAVEANDNDMADLLRRNGARE